MYKFSEILMKIMMEFGGNLKTIYLKILIFLSELHTLNMMSSASLL